jgi:hypothetical protein
VNGTSESEDRKLKEDELGAKAYIYGVTRQTVYCVLWLRGSYMAMSKQQERKRNRQIRVFEKNEVWYRTRVPIIAMLSGVIQHMPQNEG